MRHVIRKEGLEILTLIVQTENKKTWKAACNLSNKFTLMDGRKKLLNFQKLLRTAK